MNTISKMAIGAALLLLATSSLAQNDTADDADSLRMTALEALISRRRIGGKPRHQP